MIISPSNSLVKKARSLRQKKTRYETGLFLVEGIHHVGEALAAGWHIETLFYAPDLLTSEFGKGLISDCAAKNVDVQAVSPAVMESIAEKENPQGLLVIVQKRITRLSDIDPRQLRSAVALVSPQDPGNVGTILRTVDAIGADALFVLDGGVEIVHPSVVRASMGALFTQKIIETSFAEFSAWAKSANVQLIGTSARAETDYKKFTPRTPWAILLGSEQKGLAPNQLAACDARVSMPMRGRATSLNLSVAASILLYEWLAEQK